MMQFPPSMSIPSSEHPAKMTLQGSPVSLKKVSPVKLPYRLPAESEHIAMDSLTARQNKISSSLSSYDIRKAFADKYALGRILGRGASAEVYEARLKTGIESEFPFAVKIIRRDNRMNDSTTMATELEILRRVQHVHVVHLFEVYETIDTLYLVMERAQGGDLLAALASLPQYSESAVRDIFRQLLEAVDYLHSLGVVHRDLKLDNLLFDTSLTIDQSNRKSTTATTTTVVDTDDEEEDGEEEGEESKKIQKKQQEQQQQSKVVVKVTDFGLSALLPTTAATDNEHSSVFDKLPFFSTPATQIKRDHRLKDLWGTTEYFAPEVYERRYGRQADVWALGCILFEMLTGELAFPYRETPVGMVERLLFHGGGKPLRVFERKAGWSKLSKDAQSLIKQMLKTSPVKRLSIAECLRHPWFASSNKNNNKNAAASSSSSLVHRTSLLLSLRQSKNKNSNKQPQHEDSFRSVSTSSSSSSSSSSLSEFNAASSEEITYASSSVVVLNEAQEILKQRVQRRERRYQNLLAEVAMRKN